jgi:hypothetical protein
MSRALVMLFHQSTQGQGDHTGIFAITFITKVQRTLGHIFQMAQDTTLVKADDQICFGISIIGSFITDAEQAKIVPTPDQGLIIIRLKDVLAMLYGQIRNHLRGFFHSLTGFAADEDIIYL